MSDTIPRFKFGDRVRVMQTTEMEDAGVANRRGTVMGKPLTPSHWVAVALDEPDERTVEIPADSLMRVKRSA